MSLRGWWLVAQFTDGLSLLAGPTIKFHVQNSTYTPDLDPPQAFCRPRQRLRFLSLHPDRNARAFINPGLPTVHTMSELNFSGNCLKGSRPVLSFDAAFERQPHLRLIKEVFLHVFGVPQGARRSKPFVDHVMGFSVADGRIWVRNYQISESEPSSSSSAAAAAKKDAVEGEDQDMLDLPRTKGKGGGNKELDISLVEIGPRFVITPSK